MSERFPADQAAREQAVDPRQSYIVQAPAGSGKTTLLTDRIIALLAHVSRPEQIVAMTFTRKAAAEMQSRVLEKLRKAMQTEQPEDGHDRRAWELARAALDQDRRMGWRLLEQPSRLRIQTIDAFCASLVKSMPWFSALGGMPSISEDPYQLYKAAASKVLEMTDEVPAVETLLKHLDLDVQAAVDAVALMLGRRDQWLSLIGGLYLDEQAVDLIEQNLKDTIRQELEELIASMPPGWRYQLAEPARAAACSVAETSKDHAIAALQNWIAPEDLGADPDTLPLWKGLAQLLLTSKGELRKTLTKSQGCGPNTPQKIALTEWLGSFATSQDRPQWCVRLDAVNSIPSPGLSQQQKAILRAQAQVLVLAAAMLQLEFARNAQVDFIEVAQRAEDALWRADDPSDLLLKLDQQIQHLLIDEFQDTSMSQLKLLSTLVSGWQQGDGRTVFVVGDPMQSIYRFRKAEVGIFLQVRDKGLGPVRLQPLVLQENFRSSGSIVQWVNRVFEQVMPERDSMEMGAISYSHSVAWHPCSQTQAVYWHLLPSGQEVQETVMKIVHQSWSTYTDSEKPVAILVRSRSHLGDVTLALRQSGLPVRAVELESLSERTVVKDLLALARAISHPGDRAAWIAVLRAPWCGVTLATLHALLWKFPEQTVPYVLQQWLAQQLEHCTLPEDDRQRLLAVAPRLLAALQDDGRLPFAARLETLWRDLEGHRLVDEDSDLEDAQSFFELVETVAKHSTLDVELLESRLGQLFAKPFVRGSRAIEVMTMHKAKGLEFESVILMGLERKPPPDRAPLVSIEQMGERVLFGPVKPSQQEEQDPISKYLSSREQVRQAHEADRLLYVAATRARQELHLVAQVQWDEQKGAIKVPADRSMLSRIWQFCPAQAIDAAQEKLAQQPQQPPGQETQPQWVAPAMLRRADPVPCGQLTPNTAGQAVLWNESDHAERQIGTLLHAWFAHFLSTGSRQVPDAQTINRQLLRVGVPASLRPQATIQVEQGIKAMLSTERGQWLLSQSSARVEWSLVDSDEVVSVLDLALDQGNEWLVVDYKTSRVMPGEDRSAFVQRMQNRYRAQMQRYVEQLQSLDDRTARAALYFPLEDLWVEMNFE